MADNPQHCCATWAMNTGESFSSRARLPGAYPRAGYPSNGSPGRCRPASKPREPQARPLAITAAHRPVFSTARSASPRRCPALECPAHLGCSRPRLENHSASLSPRRRPPLQCLADSSPHTVATALLVQPVASLSTEPSCCSEHAQRPPPLLFKHALAPFCLSYPILH